MVICAVYGCNSSNDKKLKRNQPPIVCKPVKFFRFPKDETMQKVWVFKCARKDKFKPKNSYICSKHFTTDQYLRNLRHELLNYCPKNSKMLKPDAVPSENMPFPSKQSYSKRQERNNRRNAKQIVNELLSSDIYPDNNKPSISSTNPTIFSTSVDEQLYQNMENKSTTANGIIRDMIHNERKTIPECMTPKLSDYMQMSTGNSNTMTVTSNCHKMSATNPNTILRAALSPTVNTSINGIPQSIVFANQPNAMSGAGKISIVPTNFLMHQNKGMPQQIQIRQQPQQRIICSQQNTQSNTGIVTSAGDGRMKVLLVNAFQNGKTTTAVTTKETTYSNTNLITTANILKTNTTEAGVHKPIIETVKQTRTDEAGTSKDPGMELLFNRLIVMQSENNEIQRQRLEIERQRLEFEKSMAEKLLAALSSLNKVQKPENGTITTPRETSTSIKESAPPDIIEEFNGFPLLTPKLEKMD